MRATPRWPPRAASPTWPSFIIVTPAFQIQRAKQHPGETPIWDMLLSFTASADDPISGGRHKVLGSKALCIPPQTSTIASHLPKTVGAAFSIGAARVIGEIETVMPDDAIVICSFGDASANHSTAQGAINTACWAAYQGTPMPIIFLCEDNGVGISTRTPWGWIAAGFRNRPGLDYIACNGADLLASYEAARRAVETARTRRTPVFLHMACTRLYGHAGSDVQGVYMSKSEIAASEARDPLLSGAALLCDLDLMRPGDIREMYEAAGETIARIANDAIARPKLETSAQVMASITPPRKLAQLAPIPASKAREALFGSDWALMAKASTNGQAYQLGVDGPYGAAPRNHCRRRGCRPQGRRLQCDGAASSALWRSAGHQHGAR